MFVFQYFQKNQSIQTTSTEPTIVNEVYKCAEVNFFPIGGWRSEFLYFALLYSSAGIEMKVEIKKTQLSDAKQIHHLINDRAVISQIGGYSYPCALKRIKKDVQKGLKEWKQKKSYNFTIWANNEMAGQIMLENPSEDKKRYEIGFFVGKKFWNQGIATQAIKQITKFGFKQLKLYKIWGDNDSDNPASGKAMQKAGFKLEGQLKKHNRKKGKFVDVLIWGKTI